MKKQLAILLFFSAFNFTIEAKKTEPISPLTDRLYLSPTTVCAGAFGFYLTCYAITQLTTQHKPVKLIGQKSQADKPIFLFSHGILETHRQAFWYTKGKTTLPAILDGCIYTFDYPDATTAPWRIHFPQTGLGQSNEVLALKSAYDQIPSNTSNKRLMVGLSRGATTILNFIGQYNPQVDAVIVESPFDSMCTIVANILSHCYMNRIPGLQTVGHFLVSALFWQHSMNAPDTTHSLLTVNPDIPILFICSEEDRLIPAASTLTLYKILRAQGHNKVHIFIANHGRHGRILHGPDGEKYQHIVHAFYKQYGFPYDESLAYLGKKLLDNSQP